MKFNTSLEYNLNVIEKNIRFYALFFNTAAYEPYTAMSEAEFHGAFMNLSDEIFLLT